MIADDQRRRWLHLPVETKARELEARLLLSCAAAERGVGSVIGVKGKVNKLAVRLPKGAYLEKSVQMESLPGVRARISLGHLECCLDEEGLVYIDAEDYTLGRLGRPVLDLMHRFFAWGEDQAEIVSQFHPSLADRIRITGNPRVDFWRPELRGLHHGPVADIEKTQGHFVLITTAFAMVNNSRGERYFADSLRANGRMDTTDGAARVDGYLGHSQVLFGAMRAAVDDLARQRPNLRLVIRPHPSEDLTPWEAVAAGHLNVTVCRDGPVTPWLLAARAVVHNNSTTGLEAALLQRPTIAFAPVTDPRYDQNLPNAVSRAVGTADELVEMVDEAVGLEGLPASKANVDTLRHHLASLDGPLAADRLSDELASLDLPESRLGGGLLRQLESRARLIPDQLSRRRTGRGTEVASAQITKPRTDRSEKFPATPLGEVESFVSRLQAATGRFHGVRCAALTEKVYVILPPDG